MKFDFGEGGGGEGSRPPRGGRGLKYHNSTSLEVVNGSPPSRGAWIEMERIITRSELIFRRPPRGGRGLKFALCLLVVRHRVVAPLAGGVD